MLNYKLSIRAGNNSVPGYFRGVVSALVAMWHVLVAAVPLSQIRVRHCRKECFHLLHLHSGVSAAQD